ncbi:hypothetical protein BUALT_Bualt09G0087100 [Buddleja alternifolia]|uniref:C3H1-type domain-containing protein n=1 Tax=Buddleja alternifolia TaxID=168488 RepID=A0AAV6X7Q0_9LAMI|nr:hypothetical protein BUALT_Bualt09G0087100 [Buddleja alternifolia]
MEDSTQQTVTLNPSETSFSFPPHRRRPLRSNTCRTLARILSHCAHLQTQDESGDAESEPVSEQNGSINHDEAGSVGVLVPTPNCKEFEDTVVKETSTGKSKENAGFQDGGFDGDQITVPNLVIDGEQEVTPANRVSSEDFLVVENRTGDCAVEIAREQENMNTVVDINIDDFGPSEQLEVDNEFSVCDFSEVFDSCFGVEMVAESSKAGEDRQQNDTSLEESMPKEAEHELQLKEMELEKLIHDSSVEPPSCHTADEEIEDGEISGEVWVADEPLDASSEDVVSHGGAERVRASADSFDKEEFICSEEDGGHLRHDVSEPSLVNIVNSDNNRMQVELRKTARQMQDCHSQNVFRDSYMESPRISPIAPYLKNLTPSSKILPENAAENPIYATTEKEGDASKKKRKNGPLTEERRAKKKKKEKIRKAKKNRKLGVKRLKLQPVLKPKTIVYCRHYLQGRCHEGEKCKYSHDTVPLTKSKPCGHFARHACMKGDDCPFDHQLSKYPCTNYTSSGFCSRGSDCLFSHEIPAKQNSPTTPSVSQPQLKSSQPIMPNKEGSLMLSKDTNPKVKFQSPLSNSNSSKQADNCGSSFQKVDAKTGSSANAPCKSTNMLAAKAVPRTPGQVPKGVSFLLNSGMSPGKTSKLKQDRSSVTSSDVDVGRETNLKVPGAINKSNDMYEGVPPRRPRGINFLSFAQPSFDNFSSKMFSNFVSNSSNEKGNSVIGDTVEGKEICSLPENVGVLKVNRQMNQSATCLVPGSNEEVNGTSLTAPQRQNLLSFDKTQLDNPIFKKHANDHFNKGDTAMSSGNERQSTASKLQDAMKTPSNPLGGLWPQSTDRNNSNVSSSVKTSSVLSNTPSLVQKAVQSTLAFAAKFDIKAGSSFHQRGS